MARTPNLVSITLHDLMLLLNYRWAAVNSERIGDLGILPYEDFVSRMDMQSEVNVSPQQLADLIYHMKQVIFERVKPARLTFTARNYNDTMKKLKAQLPHMFKENSAGEVVMIELEERVGDE